MMASQRKRWNEERRRRERQKVTHSGRPTGEILPALPRRRKRWWDSGEIFMTRRDVLLQKVLPKVLAIVFLAGMLYLLARAEGLSIAGYLSKIWQEAGEMDSPF